MGQPVDSAEYPLASDKVMVFKTDLLERITCVNHYLVEVSGYDQSELVGTGHRLLHHPDLPRGVLRDIESTQQAGLAWTGLLKCRRKDGRYFFVRATAEPLMEGDQLAGYLWLCSKPLPLPMAYPAAMSQRKYPLYLAA